MTPTGLDHSNALVSTRDQQRLARQRRQTYTFMVVFGVVLVVGAVALGNWLQWWTIGGQITPVALSCPVQEVTKPELTRVNVYNATTRPGLAAAVGKELGERGFDVLSIETEEPDEPIRAVVQIRFSESALREARTVARQFPGTVVMEPVEAEDEGAVDVVIGTRYKRMVSARKGAAAIAMTPEPPNCVPAGAGS